MRQRETSRASSSPTSRRPSVHPHAREIYGSLGAGYREALSPARPKWSARTRPSTGSASRPGTRSPSRATRTCPSTSASPGSRRRDAHPRVRDRRHGAAPGGVARSRRTGFAEDRGAISLDEARPRARPVSAGVMFQGHRPDTIRRVDLRSRPDAGRHHRERRASCSRRPPARGRAHDARGPARLRATRRHSGARGMSGLLRTHGLFVNVHAPDEETAIAVARELRR